MEYPMATLCIGPGAWLHEWLHSWYYGVLGTNESLYGWMDEGFTTYAEDRLRPFWKIHLALFTTEPIKAMCHSQKAGKKNPLAHMPIIST